MDFSAVAGCIKRSVGLDGLDALDDVFMEPSTVTALAVQAGEDDPDEFGPIVPVKQNGWKKVFWKGRKPQWIKWVLGAPTPLKVLPTIVHARKCITKSKSLTKQMRM